MRVLFLLVSLLLTNVCFSQNTVVRYIEYRKAEDKSNVSFLIYNEKESYNIQSFIDLFENYEQLLANRRFVEDPVFVRSFKKEHIYSDEYFGITEIMRVGRAIYKDLFKIDWKLSDVENTILGYHCKLATTTFRGRDYKVWYTLDIPVPLGPWKLGGLPGLILKAEADNGQFSFEATDIVLNTSLQVPEKFINLYKDNRDKILDYPTVIKVENKAREEFRQEQIANLPKDVVLTEFPPIRTNLIELTIN